MELWSSGRSRGELTRLLLVALLGVAAPAVGASQSVSAVDRDALVRLRTDRGGRAEEVDVLIRLADEAAARGLPAGPLTNKIREGIAKGVDPQRIEQVVRQITTHLETADVLLRELASGISATEREGPVALLAESLGGGVTPQEIRDLRKLVPPAADGAKPPTAEGIAGAAKGLSFIKDARLPVAEGTAVMAEAVRQGFRSHELLDLGREIKRRESDYQTGRASLRALREAIARGERPAQLFRESRTESVERPAAARPEATVDRPERPSRPERPPRPDQPVRPERPATGR